MKAATNWSIANSINMSATGSTGAGGSIRIYVPFGTASFGTGDNRSDNSLYVTGVTSGGTIVVQALQGITDYEVSFNASATSGPGGSITLTSLTGSVTLYKRSWDWNSWDRFGTNFWANSTSSFGGNITISGATGVLPPKE